jgi:hypothetical protein
MKPIKKLLFLFCLLSFAFSKAQDGGFASQIGYASFASSNAFLGLDYRFGDVKDGTLNLGIGTYFGEFNTKTQSVFTPEIHVNYSLAYFFLGEMSVTTKSINPSIGLNIFNGLKIKTGYNFSIVQNGFNALTFGVSLNIGQKGYYDKFKFM